MDRHLLIKCKKALEDGISLRNLEFNDDEKRLMLPYQFLSTMPEIIVLNIGENDINSEKVGKFHNAIEIYFKETGQGATLRSCLSAGRSRWRLSSSRRTRQRPFWTDLGIDEPAMHKLCRISYDALGLLSFFTGRQRRSQGLDHKKRNKRAAGCRQDTFRIERGFIRAEVVGYDDFIASEEDMVRVKKKGLQGLKARHILSVTGISLISSLMCEEESSEACKLAGLKAGSPQSWKRVSARYDIKQ